MKRSLTRIGAVYLFCILFHFLLKLSINLIFVRKQNWFSVKVLDDDQKAVRMCKGILRSQLDNYIPLVVILV